MTETTSKQPAPADPKPEAKPGFFGRIFRKLDESMKQKADEKSQKSSCCGGDGKGGKCC
jgi:hypothetical protein